jgi:hypothetical protein
MSRTQLCTEVYGVPCPQINNSKLCKLSQISNRKLKAVKELYLGWKLPVHAKPGLCTLNIFVYGIFLSCGKFRKYHREPLFRHGNTFGRGLGLPCAVDYDVPRVSCIPPVSQIKRYSTLPYTRLPISNSNQLILLYGITDTLNFGNFPRRLVVALVS